MQDNIHINSPYDRGEGYNAGKLFRGETHLSAGDVPVMGGIHAPNQSGDIVGQPAYVLPGNPPLLNGNGTYGLMPARGYAVQGSGGYTFYPMQNPDGYIYRDTLYYRSDTTPYRDSPNSRLAPSSPNVPVDRYRFLNGRRGDIYG